MVYLGLPNERWTTRTKRALRARVFRRDHFTCQHCGWCPPSVPISYAGEGWLPFGSWPELRTLQVDHIIPRLRGGIAVEENLQALCNRCNARKGARK